MWSAYGSLDLPPPQVDPAAVPEPSSMALVALAGLALVSQRRRLPRRLS